VARLFVLFLALPWWAYFPISGGIAWLGHYAYEAWLSEEAAKVEALATAPPAVVDLAMFSRERDVHLADEVHVKGWINTDLNYRLTLTEANTNRVKQERFMYMMFGVDDPAGGSTVRAALVLNAAERDRFSDTFADYVVGDTANGPVFAFNAFAADTVALDDMAYDAIAEANLIPSPDFIFVEPFFDGREAALALGSPPEGLRKTFWQVAAVIALIGLGKAVLRARGRRPLTEEDDALADGPAVASGPRGSTAPFNAGIDPDSPIGRLAAQRVAHSAQTVPDPEHRVVPRRVRPEGAPRRQSVAEPDPVAADPPQTGASGGGKSFVVRLGLAMAAVFLVAYDPGNLTVLLLLALVGLFWLGVFPGVKRAKAGFSGLFGQTTRREGTT